MRSHSLSSFAASLIATLLFAPAAFADSHCPVFDADGDGHASIACGEDDCDDGDPARYPGKPEVCDVNDLDEDCNYDTPGVRDQDADGFNDDACRNIDPSGNVVGGDDCDDTDPSVHRIAAEVCNNKDDNCDGAFDEGLRREYFLDVDGDGFGTQSVGLLCPQDAVGVASRAGDCDDASESIIPGAQVCVSSLDVGICGTDGLWTADTCDVDQQCIAQPNELGVCGSVYSGPGNSGSGNGNNGNGLGNN